MILNRILVLVIGYVFGLFSPGTLYSKSKNKDITTVGSGNAGTTNTFRTFGWKAGALVLAGDILKCILAIVTTWFLFGKSEPEAIKVLELYAALGCILGHNYPIYRMFKKGIKKVVGKGIACTGALVIAIFPTLVPISICFLVLPMILTGYVSLGSILGVTSFLIQVILWGELGVLKLAPEYKVEIYVLVAVIVFMAIIRHRENIKNLLNGTERKSFRKNK